MRLNWTAVSLAVLVISVSACTAQEEGDEPQIEDAIAKDAKQAPNGASSTVSGDAAFTTQDIEAVHEDAPSIPQARIFGVGTSCAPNPCLNGGVCVDQWLGYTCACTPGFTGVRCEQRAAASCGNGVIDAGEGCDPAVPGWSLWTCNPTSCQFDGQKLYRPCSNNHGCDAGHACVGGACVIPGCNSDASCPRTPTGTGSRAVCFANPRVCVASCSLPDQCAPGLTCSNGVCQGCSDSRLCPGGQRCELYPGSTIGVCR